MKKCLLIWSTVVLVIGVVACDKQNPTTPTETASVTSAGPATTAGVATPKVGTSSVTLTTPSMVAPTDGQQFTFASQPITVTVKNAATTGSAALTYSIQVANDAAFTSIAFSKDAVAAGGGGQTSIPVDKLPGAKSYFVRARVSSGDQLGPFTKARSFGVGPEVVLQTPVLASPGSGATVSGDMTLTVNNIGRTGPAGTIFYRFDVSDSPSFSNLIFTQTISEQGGQGGVSAVTAQTAPPGGMYFWRVQAGDPANGISTEYSVPSSFTFQPFSMSQATIVSSPRDLANWAETARITSVEFTGGAFLVDFDKRTGPGRWPDTPFGAGNLEYTLGMCGNLGGHWYCSAVVQFWYGRDLAASAPPGLVGREWFYDARWGPLNGFQPAEGEIVGLFVCAGNCRNNNEGDASYVKERSNVAFVPWTRGGASYSFSKGGPIRLSQRGPIRLQSGRR